MDVIDYAAPSKPKTRWWFVGGLMGLIFIFLTIGIAIPSSNRARVTSPKLLSTSRLHQIGLGILLYFNDHQGNYPDSLATILREEKLQPSFLVSPNTNDTEATGNTADQIAQSLNDPTHVSYVYLGAGLKDPDVKPNQVIAYDKPGNFGDDGINILFGDGYAEFKDKQSAIKLIPNLATASWQQR